MYIPTASDSLSFGDGQKGFLELHSNGVFSLRTLSSPQLEIDSTDQNQPAKIRLQTGANGAEISSLGGDVRIQTQGTTNKLDVDGNVHVSRAVTARALGVTDSFELGTVQTPQGTAAALYIPQPNADLVVNSKARFNNDFIVDGVIAPAIAAYVPAPGRQQDLEFTAGNAKLTATNGLTLEADVTLQNLGGNGNAYVCIDGNGKLFRSDTPCR